MEINIDKLVGSVTKLEVGQRLDEAVGREVFKMKKSSLGQMVVDPVSGKNVGMSNWLGADGKTPLNLPKFSTVPFVATLMLMQFEKAVKIERTAGDESTGEAVYLVQFSEDAGSGITIQGATFAEAIARASLFEQRFFVKCTDAIEQVLQDEE